MGKQSKKTKDSDPLLQKETERPSGYPGMQLKLAPTNTHDDLMQLLLNSQQLADKFYSSRTIKSGTNIRKIYLEISKRCLAERKLVLEIRGKKIKDDGNQ